MRDKRSCHISIGCLFIYKLNLTILKVLLSSKQHVDEHFFFQANTTSVTEHTSLLPKVLQLALFLVLAESSCMAQML